MLDGKIKWFSRHGEPDFFYQQLYFLLGGVCLTNPCHNGGSCVNVGETFECICRKGFTGKKCKGEYYILQNALFLFLFCMPIYGKLALVKELEKGIDIVYIHVPFAELILFTD